MNLSLINTFYSRFVPDKQFSGTDRSTGTRSGPVQFEKDEDPFGLDQFLKQAKRASSSIMTTRHKDERDQRKDDRDKRRKH